MNSLTGLHGLDSGSTWSYQQIVSMQKALRDAAESVMKGSVGYPSQGTAYTGQLAPLVPQSIQSTFDSASYMQSAIVFWNMLTKVSVTSPLHEKTLVNKYGGNIDPFFGEGSTPGFSEPEHERQTFRVKFMAEKVEISDVAAVTSVLGPDRTMLALRTMEGTLNLLGNLERYLFNADSTNNTNQFDGLYKQITTGAPQNMTDLRGDGFTFQDLQDKMGRVAAAPNFGHTNTILVEPRQFYSLQKQAQSYGRFDMRSPSGGGVTFGHNELSVVGPRGPVRIISCPLIRPTDTPSATAEGTAPNGGATPTVTPAAVSSGTSYWTSSDAGVYNYVIEAVGDSGATAHSTTAAVTVASGQVVRFTIADGAVSGIKYYRIYRTTKNPTATTTADHHYVLSIPVNTDGADSATVVYDRNRYIPQTAPVYLLQNTPDVMQWIQMLDFMRRPLAQTTTTIPFLLMLFGAPIVSIPKRCWVLDNAALEF